MYVYVCVYIQFSVLPFIGGYKYFGIFKQFFVNLI